MLARAGLLIAAIAAIDWKVQTNVSLGFLYLFPMLMVGAWLEPWQLGIVAAICTELVELFDPFPFVASEGIPRVILVFAAFFGTGLFAYESARNRRLALQHVAEIETESEARRDAEEQLRVLIESSPAAIFTLDGDGRVVLANSAAHRLFGVPPDTLAGQMMRDYLPAIGTVPFRREGSQIFRTEMECRGRKRDGEPFLASVWFSSYRTRSGPRLAAVVADVSEELRDREESGLRQFMDGSRVVIATVCHELRNMCGAIAVLHANLGRSAGIAGNEDYKALSTLVEGLGKIASLELYQSATDLSAVDLMALLDELRIIIEPQMRESGIHVIWRTPPSLPKVRADRHTLLQVFLNLIKNSARALENANPKTIMIGAESSHDRVTVRVTDTGPGVGAPQYLFQAFQPAAQATGLGLFISRALLRRFGGDLTYDPPAKGSCFTITLVPVTQDREETSNDEDGATAAGGRSRAIRPEPGATAGGRT